MRLEKLHDWSLDYGSARELQARLCRMVRLSALRGAIRLVAGADVAIDKAEKQVFAAVVVLGFPGLGLLEQRTWVGELSFPYIPGLLSFREGPAVLECFRRIELEPDVVLMDGQGIAHPRGIGLASHIGLWLNIPTIGCAKSRLVGEYEEPGDERGGSSPLFYEGRTVGAVLRTRTRVKPLFISPGHLIDIDSSIRIALQCAEKYRLPEPTRLAHQAVTAIKAQLSHGSQGKGGATR